MSDLGAPLDHWMEEVQRWCHCYHRHLPLAPAFRRSRALLLQNIHGVARDDSWLRVRFPVGRIVPGPARVIGQAPPGLPAQLHPGYLLWALWWLLICHAGRRAALIGLTRRPRVWRFRPVRGTKASTARSADDSAPGGPLVLRSCSAAARRKMAGSCNPWPGVLSVLRTYC